MATLSDAEKLELEARLTRLTKGLKLYSNQDWHSKIETSFRTQVDLHQLSTILDNIRESIKYNPGVPLYFDKIHKNMNEVVNYINELQQKPVRNSVSRLEIAAQAQIPTIIHDIVQEIYLNPSLLVPDPTNKAATTAAEKILDDLNKNHILRIVEHQTDFAVLAKLEMKMKRCVLEELRQEVEDEMFMNGEGEFDRNGLGSEELEEDKFEEGLEEGYDGHPNGAH